MTIETSTIYRDLSLNFNETSRLMDLRISITYYQDIFYIKKTTSPYKFLMRSLYFLPIHFLDYQFLRFSHVFILMYYSNQEQPNPIYSYNAKGKFQFTCKRLEDNSSVSKKWLYRLLCLKAHIGKRNFPALFFVEIDRRRFCDKFLWNRDKGAKIFPAKN